MNIDIKSIKRLMPSIVVLVIAFLFLSVYPTKRAVSASLTTASVTLANSRMSYKAPISTGAAGSSLITISGAAPDTTTNHLFPGDAICFTDAGNNVCRDNTTYIVSSVPTSTTFNLTTPLTTALTATDFAVASQSGDWTLGFTSVAQVPIGGTLVLTIPMADGVNGSNRIPDSGASTATSGFDIGRLGPSNFAFQGGGNCTAANWGTPTIATGSGTVDHVITWTRTGSICGASTTFSILIGGPDVVNPAPITGHTQGSADVYGVTIVTKDGSGNVLDSATPRVAPVEAVLISTTVDESLTLTIAGLTGGAQTYCGSKTYVASTATTIPWGTQVGGAGFKYSAQQLTVSTNAANGYAVTIQENDQMGKNGVACPNTSPASGDYTFTGPVSCIRDTVCTVSTCTESTAGDWTTSTNYGLGYTLASQSGTDAPFFYNEKNRAWSAKQLADVSGNGAAAETPASIMSNSGPVSASSIYVCYTLTIPGSQPAGYYYNIAKYTATATF